LSWSHSIIHATSRARTRTKSMAASSSFQRVLISLVSTSYDGVIAETERKCRLNPRWTWQLSRRRSPTWERSWRMCVQNGDVLITALGHFSSPIRRHRRRPPPPPPWPSSSPVAPSAAPPVLCPTGFSTTASLPKSAVHRPADALAPATPPVCRR
jgi:hypothetical protein